MAGKFKIILLVFGLCHTSTGERMHGHVRALDTRLSDDFHFDESDVAGDVNVGGVGSIHDNIASANDPTGITDADDVSDRPFCRLCVCELNWSTCGQSALMQMTSDVRRCVAAGPICCCCRQGRYPCINFSADARYQPAGDDRLSDLDVDPVTVGRLE